MTQDFLQYIVKPKLVRLRNAMKVDTLYSVADSFAYNVFYKTVDIERWIDYIDKEPAIHDAWLINIIHTCNELWAQVRR